MRRYSVMTGCRVAPTRVRHRCRRVFIKLKQITRSAFIVGALGVFSSVAAVAKTGYFREPGLGREVLTFVSEGDIWAVNPDGGVATRLTTHAARESSPQVSPDGKLLAFSARYQGPSEVYVMPIAGGAPRRLTFDGATRASVVGWTSDNRVLYATSRYSGLPRLRLYSVDTSTGVRQPLPSDDAEAGCYAGSIFVFTRKGSWNDNVKNYQGGLARSLWRFDGMAEAVPLTGDYAGMSWNPMCAAHRVYFLSDRDGTTNVWSMNLNGRDQIFARQNRERTDSGAKRARVSGVGEIEKDTHFAPRRQQLLPEMTIIGGLARQSGVCRL